MTIITNLIKFEQNGIEFYTVEATGESGISQSGLAKLCGVTRPSIVNFAKTLTPVTCEGETVSEPSDTKSFEDFTLVTNSGKAVVNGRESGSLRIYRSNFCIAAIKYYAEKGKKEALHSLLKFAELGFETWVQQITGWKPPQTDQPILEPEPQPQIEPPTLEVTAEQIPPELPPAPEEPTLHPALKFIQDAIDMGEKLGGFDSGEQAIVRAKLAKAIQVAQLSELTLPTPVEAPQQYTIAERAFVLGHRINQLQTVAAGKFAAELYRKKHDKNPPQRLTNYNGGVSYVNVYSGRDLSIADLAIQTVAERGY
jgi:hypothetical protein